jgi:cation:H+ antiporter
MERGMALLLQIILLVIGFLFLVKGADVFVEGAAGIADKFGIPQLVIGLTIVAMGTSAPEAAVSITAAFKGSADITIGNIIGSNIMNILVILGVTAVITAVPVQKSTLRYEIPFVILLSVLLVALGYDGSITFVDAVVLVVLFVGFIAYTIMMAMKEKDDTQEETKKRSVWLLLLMTAGGLAVVVLGSNLAVSAASEIAAMFGVSERFIGLTIVALGTSLPELMTSVTAARKHNADIAIGNIVGSNIFNIAFVVGLTGLITTVPFQPKFIIDGIVAVLAAVLLLVSVLVGRKLSRPAGVIMLIAYAGYFAYLVVA